MATTVQAIRFKGKWYPIPEADARAVNQVKRGNLDQAIEICDLILGKVPGHVPAHYHRAIALEKSGQKLEALAGFDRAAELSPKHPGILINKATTLANLRRYDEAIAVFQNAIELDPRNINALLACANAMVISGDMTGAENALRRTLEIDPHQVDAAVKLLDLRRSTDPENPDIQRLTALLKIPGLSEPNRAHLHFGLGKALDDCGLYEEAFTHYEAANRFMAARHPYDAKESGAMTDAIIRVFSREFLAQPFPFASADETPVFVVGLNRSGTTLIASMLSNHPQVASAGELPAMDELTLRFHALTGSTYPEGVPTIAPEAGQKMIAEYLQRLRQNTPAAATHVVDKLPLNFRHLGLIAKLFPKAHVIHCVRHPLDTGLSNFFQRFSSVCNFSYSLNAFGHHYLEYKRLMEHWKSVLPLRFLEVKYEDMVLRTDDVAREALNFLSLEWNERCRAPHLNPNPVETCSSWQVRQPIYSHAIGRWKHYEKQLGALKAMIEPSD